MKMSMRLRYLLGGAVLILATNAVVLGGVAYNRSGTPESTLALTQRELRLPYHVFSGKSENSGLVLNLLWRVAAERSTPTPYVSLQDLPRTGGAPAWLDKARMAELGFDMGELEKQKQDPRDFRLWQEKDVLLVLEFDGAAYQRALEIARQLVAKDLALLAASTDKDRAQLERNLKFARKRLVNEENKNSRLFVVDAGLSLQALRARYADRTKYAIVHGLVRPRLMSKGKAVGIGGFISGLSIDAINVPLKFRPVFASLAGDRHFQATVSFGKRLEPWLKEVSAAEKP